LLDAIEAHLEQNEVPPVASAQLMIAFDEIISNVLKHGGGSHIPTVDVLLDITEDGEGGSVTAEVVDDGKPFDPLSMPEPDISLSVEDRQIGGLGIHLVRKLMSEVAYVYEEGRNRLRFSKIYTLD
jgi:serine/threonine-protein kinase RsbW